MRSSVKAANNSLVKNFFCIVFLVAALLLPSSVHAGSTNAPAGRSTVTLTWDRSPDQTVKGYRLHYGTTSGRNYSRIVDVGKVTTYTLSNLITGKKYYVVVTAYDASGKESPASNEISFTASKSPRKSTPATQP